MIGDKIFVGIQDKKRAKELLPNLLALHDRSIITIGGGSGCRKTELACCIQEEFYSKNKHSILLSLDDCYSSHYKDRLRIRRRNGIGSVGIKEIDWRFIKRIIKDFKNNKDIIKTQEINKYTGNYNNVEIYGVKGVNYLICEGLFANQLKKLKLSNYAVHLEGTPLQTISFRKKRGKEKETSQFRQQIVKKEYKITNQLKNYADIVIQFNKIC